MHVHLRSMQLQSRNSLPEEVTDVSTTPKTVRRAGGNCYCPDSSARLKNRDYDDGLCRYGYCSVARCRSCHGVIFSVGPVGCRCDGGPRWARHRGMEQLGHWDLEKDNWVPVHAAVKPSLARRRSHGRP